MTTSLRTDQRGILLGAVREFVDEARSERALVAKGTSARQFYLGVDAAAQEVLYPELALARREGWLEMEDPSFREGYLRASTILSGAANSDRPPLHLAVPHPSPN